MSFAEHYQDYYDAKDDAFRAWRAHGAIDKCNNIITLWARVAGDTRAGSVADIGCGDGAVAARLDEAGFYDRLTGYDVSSSGIAVANSRDLPRATFVQADDERLPATDQEFDLAILSHVVEHVDEPRRIIREASRIAKFVFVEVPLESHLRMPAQFQWTDTGHVNFYNRKLIRQLVQSCGLTVLHETVSNPSHEHYIATGDRRGLAKWWIKQILLNGSQSVATSVFTYHGALIARA